MSRPAHLEAVPENRRALARDVAAALLDARRIVMTTHVNSDGDGLVSQMALLHLLASRGREASIVNPSPIPDRYQFLMESVAARDLSSGAAAAIRAADLILVLDISDLGRLGNLAEQVRARGVKVACIDHHVSPGTLPEGPRLVDPEASATAELVYDLAVEAGRPVDPETPRHLSRRLPTDTPRL